MSYFRVFPAATRAPEEPARERRSEDEINEIRAQDHAARRMALAMDGWLRLMPWLKYTARNDRLLRAAQRKREAGVCRACLHALVLNYSRNHDRSVSQSGRRSRLLSVWCTWMRATLDTKQRQHIFQCLRMREVTRKVNRAAATRINGFESLRASGVHFAAWRVVLRRRRRLLRLCKDLARRYDLSIMADKFKWWVCAYLNWLQLRESVGSLFHRVSFSLSSHAFLEWAAFVQESHRLLILGTKALLRWDLFLQRQSFKALVVLAKGARKMTATIKLVSARGRKIRLGSCFGQLKKHSSQRVRLRAMHVRSLNLWMRSIRTKFLLRWWDNVHEAKRLNCALRKAENLHMTGKISWSTTKCKQYVLRALRERLKTWNSYMHAQRRVHRVSWRISRLAGIRLRRRFFEVWRFDARKQKRNLLSVARALACRHFRGIRHCLDMWCGETQRIKQMERICLDHSTVAAARKVVKYFYKWRAHTTAQGRLIVSASKVIARRDLYRVAGYFYFLARLTHKWKRIGVWCDKWDRSTTRWAFCLWCDERLRCVQRDRKWEYTAAKMMQGLLKRLFHHWASSHIETNLDKRIIKKMAMRVGLNAVIAPHLQHWRSLIKRRNLVNRTLRLNRLREKPGLKNKYFKMWYDRKEYRRMVWSVSRRIKIRWFAMIGTQAFYTWRRHLSSRANIKALLHHVAIHRHFHFCASFFAAWDEQVREGKRVKLNRSMVSEHDKDTQLSDLKERLVTAEKFVNSAEEEKAAIANELATAREERASAYRVIEALNASEQGSKTRIENLVSRLDEASYMYDRLEEMQSLVKELQTVRRTSTDQIYHLQIECDVSKAEKESIAKDLLETRDKLNSAKHELERRDIEQERYTAQTEDLSFSLSRCCGTLQWNLDKVEQVLTIAKDAYERAVTINSTALVVHDRRERENKELSSSLASFKRENQELSLRLSVLEDTLASEKQRSLGLILPPADEGNKESVLLVFDMDIQDIKDKELDFVDDVAAHVSNALDVHPARWVSVSNLQIGSIKARVWFGPGPSSNGLLPSDAINLILTQAQKSGSKLLSGDLGSKIKSVESLFRLGLVQGSPANKNKDEQQIVTMRHSEVDGAPVITNTVNVEKQIAGISRGTARTSRSANPGAANPALPSFPVLPDEVDLITIVGGIVRMTITLGLDFRVTGTAGSSQRTIFENNLLQDLSEASGYPQYCFDIKKFAQDSVVVDFEIRPSPSVPMPMLVATTLMKQMSEPASALCTGTTTRYATSLTLEDDPIVLSGSSEVVKTATQSSRQSNASAGASNRMSFASVVTDSSDTIELLANDRAMRERIYALECLMAEKEAVYQELKKNEQSANKLREDLQELQRVLKEKDRVLEETDQQNSALKRALALHAAAAVDHGLLPTHRGETSSAPPSSFGGQHLVQKTQASGPVRTAPPVAAPGTRAETEQLLQFQSTLRKAEAALAEQSTIVEAQQQSIEAAKEQNKLLHEKLEKSCSDLAEQAEISELVTTQLQKLSEKNAELTKEISVLQKRAEEEAQNSERLRMELQGARHLQEQGPKSCSHLEWELGAQKQRADELQRRLEDMKIELARSMDIRRQQNEEAVLERQKLEAEKKSAVERQQIVIDRLMFINDKNRERRNSGQTGEQYMEDLQLRALSAEKAVQESMSMYQKLKDEMLRQEQERTIRKQVLDASLGGDTARAEGLIAERTENALITNEEHQRELKNSILLMRAKTRWECLSKAQDVMLKRRSFKLVDLCFSNWADLIDEVAFEKLLEESQSGIRMEAAAVVAPGTITAPSKQELSLETAPVAIEKGTTVTMSAAVSPPLRSPPPSPLIHSSSSESPIPPRRHQESGPRLTVQSTPPSSDPRSPKTSPILAHQTIQSTKTSPILAHQAIPASLPETSYRTLDLPRSAVVSREQPDSLSVQVLQLVGLKLRTTFPPYVVEHSNGLVDVFGNQQGDAPYSNQIVEEGDTLLFVDGVDVSLLGAIGIVKCLTGQAYTQVHLAFSSRRTSSLYRITVLRHAQQVRVF